MSDDEPRNTIVVQQRMTNRLLVKLIQLMWPTSQTMTDMVEVLTQTGATDEEVAAAIGTTEATVATLKQRARKAKADEHEVLRDRAPGEGGGGVEPAGHDEDVRGVEQRE